MNTIEKSRRELFENEYVQYRQYLKRNKDGSYNEEWVDARWQGFNAALDLLVIEFISEQSISESDDPWSVRDWCIGAITDKNLGIKIK